MKNKLYLLIIYLFLISFLFSQSEKNSEPYLIPKNTVTLLFGGDTHFLWGVKDLQKEKGLFYPIEKLSHIFYNVDFRALNIETVISENGKSKNHKTYVFQSNPENLKLLNYLKIDLAFLGNNHTYDLEEEGVNSMLEHFRNSGIITIGAGMNEEEAVEPAIFEIKNIKFAFYSLCLIGPNYIYSASDKAGVGSLSNRFYLSLNSIRKKVDYVIVSLHWGIEYNVFPTENQRNITKNLFQKGVDFIIGHHPHIPQSINVSSSKAVVYSLGNFLFGSANYLQNNNIITIFHFSEKDKKFLGIEVIPITGIFRKYGYQLQLPDENDTLNLLQEIYILSLRENKNQKILVNNKLNKLFFIAQD